MAGFCRDGHNYAILAAVFGGILIRTWLFLKGTVLF